MLNVFFLRERQSEDKLGAYTLRADNIDVLVVSLNDFFYNGKAKAGALFVFASGKVSLIEAIPDALDTVFRDTNTCVFYGDEDFSVSHIGFYGNRRLVVGELGGIIDKVVENLLNFAYVCGNQKLLACKIEVEGELFLIADVFKGLDGGTDDIVDIKIHDI